MAKKWLNPEWWAGLTPMGVGKTKPNHILEMVKTVVDNRDQLPFAWRILNNGVCDGCALGTSGMRDFTMDGIHLCTVRLNLLRLNTMPALNSEILQDIQHLRTLNSKQLRELGRMPYPMHYKKGDRGFKRITWNDAYTLMANKIKATTPERLSFYLTSRGLTNEVYYMAQKAVRLIGTNNIDNSARTCHAPSTTGLMRGVGAAASTCSYSDWIGSDLIVFVGSNVANNQPVTTKYLYYAKQNGTKIAVVNPYREPGLEKYWVPSVPESAIFGTKLMDDFYQIHTGGDIAFFNGVLKFMIEQQWCDDDFINQYTAGFEDLKFNLEQQSWEFLEKFSGASRERMQDFAHMYKNARTAIFVWSMGITQHVYGVDNVLSIINLALSKGMVGKKHCGLMPIRGHSGVQGSAEVGCVPWTYPGGLPINKENSQIFEEQWGFEVPDEKGYTAVEMLDAAHDEKLDFLYTVGGNFLETLPDPDFIEKALQRVPFRVHQDIVLTPQMFVEAEDILLLPAQTRYEQRGGGTETTTERQIIFSPEIAGRRIGESKAEWEIFMELAEHVKPEQKHLIHVEHVSEILADISRAVPFYKGIENLKKKGDHIQWGGRRLCEGYQFNTFNKKANFSALNPPESQLEEGQFWMSTRRGKQFNSIVQNKRDPLNGAFREAVLINRSEANKMDLSEGDEVILRSEVGQMTGYVKYADIKPRNIQLHWPEANVLLKTGVCEPVCGIPDYNSVVEIIPLKEAEKNKDQVISQAIK